MAIICSACFLLKEKAGIEDLIDKTELIDLPDSTIILGTLTLDSTKTEPMYPEEQRINDLISSIFFLTSSLF